MYESIKEAAQEVLEEKHECTNWELTGRSAAANDSNETVVSGIWECLGDDCGIYITHPLDSDPNSV